MGVDNNGILFFGLKEEDLDLERLPGFEWELYDEAADECLADISDKLGLGRWEYGLTIQNDNGYDYNFRLVGFKLANSGSYGCREVDDLGAVIKERTKQFKELFGVDPKIFIMNYQW